MFNIKSAKDVEAIITHVETSENVTRKNDNFGDYRVLQGDQRPLLTADLKEEFPDSYTEMRIMEYNFMRKIVNKRAKIYKDGITRHILFGGKKDPVAQEVFDNVYKWMDIDNKLKKANGFYEAFWYCLPQTYLDKDNYIQIRVMPPYLYDIVADVHGNERVVVLSHYVESGHMKFELTDILDEQELYTLWTDTDHVVVRRTIDGETKKMIIEFLDIEGNEGNINPLETLPFVFSVKKPTDGFYYPMRNSMALQCMDINKTLSDVMSIARNQGFGQAVMSAAEEIMPENVKVGFKSLIKIPIPPGGTSGKFEFVNSNAPISEQMDAIAENIGMYLTTNDLVATEVSGKVDGADALNGISRLIESAKLDYSIDDAKTLFKFAEQELFELIQKWLDILKAKNQLPEEYKGYQPKNYELVLDFHETSPIQGDEDKLNMIERKLELGLIESWEKHKILNPDMSDEEAKAKEELIKADKAQKLLEQQQLMIATGFAQKEEDDDGEEQVQTQSQPNAVSQRGNQEQDQES
jgi:hypothetical protein